MHACNACVPLRLAVGVSSRCVDVCVRHPSHLLLANSHPPKKQNPHNKQVNPVLLRKGSTSVALYGLGNMRDERLNRMWNKKKASGMCGRSGGFVWVWVSMHMEEEASGMQ